MRLRIAFAVAACAAALATAGPVTGAAAATYVPHRCYVGDHAAWRPLFTRTRRGPTYFGPDPGRKLIVLSPGETVSADIAFGVAGSRANSVLASYLEVTPPGGHRHFVLRIPYGPALIYRGQVDVTALARHTPYFP